MAKTVTLADGTVLPALGMGTWNMGETSAGWKEDVASLRYGVEAGLKVVDTAEMYGQGRSESLVGDAVSDMRDKVFLVTKVLPSNATAEGVAKSCRVSLRRLATDRIDLYLLHWRGRVPLEETVEAFRKLKEEGLIRYWGVSNFDVKDMLELERLTAPCECVANQILYNLEHRGVEYDLLDTNRFRHVTTMAYSPIGQGGALLRNAALKAVAARHTTSTGPATAAQIALAWVLRVNGVMPIPKATSLVHLKENIAAQEITLSDEDLALLDTAFPPPTRKVPLDMI